MDAHRAVSQRTDKSGPAHRVFTAQSAQAALPLVRRVVSDIVETYHVLMGIQDEYQALLRRGPSEELESLRDRRQEYTGRIGELSEELEQIGCNLTDYHHGVVDFPAVLDGREVDLCWRLGESAIAYWHEAFGACSTRAHLPAEAVTPTRRDPPQSPSIAPPGARGADQPR